MDGGEGWWFAAMAAVGSCCTGVEPGCSLHFRVMLSMVLCFALIGPASAVTGQFFNPSQIVTQVPGTETATTIRSGGRFTCPVDGCRLVSILTFTGRQSAAAV